MASPSPEKRCLYEVLNLPIDCSPEEIRSAYKRLALQRHPDKLVQSGLSPSAATASFQELVNAYEVLSDPRERTWYDSHRSQILFSNPSSSSSSSSSIPNLFPFFSNSVFSGFSDSGKGFFKVYADVFDKIYANEVDFARKLRLRTPVKEAPLMGNLKSPYTQVKAFYDYWLGFLTVMDFCWVDQYDSVSGVNRKSRRVMEDENKKLRKKAKREFNETVRGLAEFAKKRDKRVIDMMVKKEAEMEKKREEERERKKEREREKAERLRAYEEPEWAKVDEEIERGLLKEELMENGNEKERQEFYCVACGKKFKSDKQWKNHEQSKKHKEKVSYLRHSLMEDDEILGEKGLGGGFSVNGDAGESGFEHKGDGVDELNKKLEDDFKIETEANAEAEVLSVAKEAVTETVKMTDYSLGLDDENVVVLEDSESEALSSADEADDVTKSDNTMASTRIKSESFGSDDESSVLEAMVSGHRSERKETMETQTKPSPENAHDDLSGDNLDFMEYNNRKTRRRKKEGKKGKAKVFDEEPMRDNDTGVNTVPEESDVHESSVLENAPSHSLEKNDNEDNVNYQSKRSHHKGSSSKQPVERKSTLKQETDSKSKNSLKGGRKQKGTSKQSSSTCDACGEDFGSRNKLHKHLGDTDHATLKSR